MQYSLAMLVMASTTLARFDIRLRPRSTQNTSVTLQGVDFWGSATVGKGSNAQIFQFEFDTGSGDISVPSKNDSHGGDGYNLSGTNLHYNSSDSFGKRSFSVSGPVYEDDVTVAGYTAKNLRFFVTEKDTLRQTLNQQNSHNAVMGMEYRTSSSSKKASDVPYLGFFESLVQQKQVNAAEFAFFLGRGIERSELMLGGRNKSLYTGDFVTAPLNQQRYWNITVGGVSVNGVPVGMTGGPAIVDTGTTFINVPTAIGNAIHAAIPGGRPTPEKYLSASDNGGKAASWLVPCNITQDHIPTINIAGRSHTIDLNEFTIGPFDGKPSDLGLKMPNDMFTIYDQMCMTSFVGDGLSKGLGWVLGVPFLTSWYTVFQWGEATTGNEVGKGTAVSFAKAVHAPNA